eukprot:CAMPEP_0117655258 /NCGR_PEP_ID=MMETSP0804-20121206/4185_1 /TAXON_ID=1074897 /ORGANISM="Tetraselmis astigmatica, Strain CCMP880" /LENGTH=106 /DNA_ID=CAMNT_0005461601 /DNA_START=276 /DNA_END=597 /DNA_ORIENTATION=+
MEAFPCVKLQGEGVAVVCQQFELLTNRSPAPLSMALRRQPAKTKCPPQIAALLTEATFIPKAQEVHELLQPVWGGDVQEANLEGEGHSANSSRQTGRQASVLGAAL